MWKVDSSESGEMKLELSPIGRVSLQPEMDDVLVNVNKPDLGLDLGFGLSARSMHETVLSASKLMDRVASDPILNRTWF